MAELVTTAAVSAAVRSACPERSGHASGLNNTARQIGTAFGVAIFGAIAGNPGLPSMYVAGMHRLAYLGCGLWPHWSSQS